MNAGCFICYQPGFLLRNIDYKGGWPHLGTWRGPDTGTWATGMKIPINFQREK